MKMKTDQGEASTVHGLPKITSKPEEGRRESVNRFFLNPQRKPPLLASWSQVPASGTVRKCILLFKPPNFWYFVMTALANWYKGFPCYCMYPQFVTFCGWVLFHCMAVLYIFYSFSNWRTFGLPPVFNDYKWNCYRKWQRSKWKLH